jgi:hypothetical protein
METVKEGARVISHIPPLQLFIIVAGVLALLAFAVYAIKYLGIMSVGPVKREQANTLTMYSMSEELKTQEERLHRQLWQDTGQIKRFIRTNFSGVKACVAVRVALYQTMLLPLLESLIENNLTREFLEENFGAYYQRLSEALREEYVSILDFTMGGCENSELPSHDAMAGALNAILDRWLFLVAHKLLVYVEERTRIYTHYQGLLKEKNDEFRVKMIADFLESNERSREAFKAYIDRETAAKALSGCEEDTTTQDKT